MQTPRRPDPKPYLADLADMRLWFIALVAVIVRTFGEDWLPRAWRIDVRAWLRVVAFEFRRNVAAVALARFPADGRARRARRPRYAPPGFRRARTRGSALRHLVRGVRWRHGAGSIGARIARLRRMLAEVERWVAGLLVRMETLSPFPRLVPVAPAAQRLRPSANVCPAPADSS